VGSQGGIPGSEARGSAFESLFRGNMGCQDQSAEWKRCSTAAVASSSSSGASESGDCSECEVGALASKTDQGEQRLHRDKEWPLSMEAKKQSTPYAYIRLGGHGEAHAVVQHEPRRLDDGGHTHARTHALTQARWRPHACMRARKHTHTDLGGHCEAQAVVPHEPRRVDDGGAQAVGAVAVHVPGNDGAHYRQKI
jgi:hypothetical protein